MSSDRPPRSKGPDKRGGKGGRSYDSRGGKGGKGGKKSYGGRDDRGDRPRRPEPQNEAERRAAKVRATRGPRRTPITEESERAKIEGRELEEWVDEGSVLEAAEGATQRGAQDSDDRQAVEIDPEVISEIHAAADVQRAERLADRLASASAALDRERYDQARHMITPLVRELPTVAAVHEVHGLACYRTGRWLKGAESLEMARQLRPDPALLPPLADCYRALRRWDDVESVWRDVKAASPSQDIMAEARIVVASSYADQGDLKKAIATMKSSQKAPKRVRDHHMREWYVLGDFYDRAGDTMTASRWFGEISAYDPNYADVRQRLRSIGR